MGGAYRYGTLVPFHLDIFCFTMLINFDSSTVMVIISYRSEGFLHE